MESANFDVPKELEDPEENVLEELEDPEENVLEELEDPEENVLEELEDPEENVLEELEDPEENVLEELEDPEEKTSTIRHGLVSCLFRCISEVTIFFFGMMAGVPGGALLGRAAIVVLRSLEHLAEDKLVMDQLVHLTNTLKSYDLYLSEQISIERRRDNLYVFNVFSSILAEEFGSLAAILSSSVGLVVGWLMYDLVIKTSGEGARGKALSVAGPLCLTVMSAVGCLLGHLLHVYLSVTPTVIIGFCFVVVTIGIFYICMKTWSRCSVLLSVLTMWAFSPLNTPIVLSAMFVFTFVLQSKYTLKLVLIAKMSPMTTFAKSYGISIITIPMSMFLLITDVFNFARQPIVILQQANTSSTGSAAVEGLFVGVLSTYFMMICVGLSLFAFEGITAVGKIGAGAVSSGVAVIVVMESVVPVLGPGPTIGALMGVAGTVGVALTAAVLAAFRYGRQMGTFRLTGVVGVTAGAAVGAYLTSVTHSGLSALYMCLSAATIPSPVLLQLIINFLEGRYGSSEVQTCFFLLVGVQNAVWVYFTVPIQSVQTFLAFLIVCSAEYLVLLCVSFAFDIWVPGLFRLRRHRRDESDPSSPDDQFINQLTKIMKFFSVNNLSQTAADLYQEIGSKLVHSAEGLRQRPRLSESRGAM